MSRAILRQISVKNFYENKMPQSIIKKFLKRKLPIEAKQLIIDDLFNHIWTIIEQIDEDYQNRKSIYHKIDFIHFFGFTILNQSKIQLMTKSILYYDFFYKKIDKEHDKINPSIKFNGNQSYEHFIGLLERAIKNKNEPYIAVIEFLFNKLNINPKENVDKLIYVSIALNGVIDAMVEYLEKIDDTYVVDR
jgi:hypothetical protein